MMVDSAVSLVVLVAPGTTLKRELERTAAVGHGR
jgi:hypothetical protein